MKIRALTSPEVRLSAMAEGISRAEVYTEKLIERSRPAWEWAYGAWRRLATVAVLLFTVWLFLHVMFGANGMVIYRGKRAEYEELKNKNDRLQQENRTIREQIDALQNDSKTIEKEAREQLHYARPGEVVYVAPQATSPQKPPSHSARK